MSTTPLFDMTKATPVSAPPPSSAPPAKPLFDMTKATPVTGSAPETPNANPRSEGVYQMQSPDGRAVQIPYSNVKTAGPQGYRFSNQGELARYAKDHSADPIDEGAVDKYLDNVPWWDMPGHALNLLSGVGTGVEKTAAGLDRAVRGNGPLTGPEEQLQLAAATPTKGGMQAAGEAGENVGEFFSGEELLGLVGKGLQGAEKLKAATQAAQLLERHPLIAKLVKIGQNAVRQGTIAGAQTYAKTGGDTGAALATGLETGALGGGIEGAGALAKGAIARLTPAVSTGAADYAGEARAAVRPHLESVSNAIEGGGAAAPRASSETGIIPAKAGAIMPRETAAAAAAAKPPALDVDRVLNTVHDFTGAADRLADVNNAAYDALDKVTGGQFRQVNSEVSRAQKAAWKGGPEQAQTYKEAQQKMEDLLSSTQGISRDTLQAVKDSWKASYQLRDMGDIWDRAINGIPGASKVSQAQRGVNGNVLMNGLQRAVRDYGRPQLEATLGQGRLENLENIARLNQTNGKREVFNRGVTEVARYLPIYLGAKIGEHVAGFPGEIGGVLVGGAVKPAMDAVFDAIKANPKIGQYFTYAIDAGADPKKFGPILATMIQQANTESSRQQQEEEETSPGENEPGDQAPSPGSRGTDTMVIANPKGLVEAGNLPIWRRPTVQNADGSHSSEYSVSFADEHGHEVLVPTVVNGKFLTPDGKKPPEGSAEEKAMFRRGWAHYGQTGENLGKFDNPDDADVYAQQLHNRGNR